MPYDEPDATDPQELIGVVLPGGSDETREMAYVFAEEFARLGYSRGQILALLQNPFYAGAYGAYRALGHAVTASIVDECVAVWGRVCVIDRDAEHARTPPITSRGRHS